MEEGKKKKYKCKKCGFVVTKDMDKCPQCGQTLYFEATENNAETVIIDTPMEIEKVEVYNSKRVLEQEEPLESKEGGDFPFESNENKSGEAVWMTFFFGFLALLYCAVRYPKNSYARESFCKTFSIVITICLAIGIISLVIGLAVGLS